MIKVSVSESIYNDSNISVGSVYLSAEIKDASKAEDLKHDMEAFAEILKNRYLGKKIENNGSKVS
jgi:hypothetical protein